MPLSSTCDQSWLSPGHATSIIVEPLRAHRNQSWNGPKLKSIKRGDKTYIAITTCNFQNPRLQAWAERDNPEFVPGPLRTAAAAPASQGEPRKQKRDLARTMVGRQEGCGRSLRGVAVSGFFYGGVYVAGSVTMIWMLHGGSCTDFAWTKLEGVGTVDSSSSRGITSTQQRAPN